MATQLQVRRGTTAQMNAFTGAEGELAVNTTTDTVHVHDGSTAGGFALAKADGSNIATYAGSFTTISASGAITANGGIALGDSDKATFGASDDLQIYHDGSNSFISDQGTGHLKLLAGDFRLNNAADDAQFISAVNGAEVNLYHNNALKLATTSTGIDVTGTVTATKLVSKNGVLELDDNGSHNGVINVPASLFINIDSDNGATGEDFVIAKDRTGTSGGTELFRVQEDGSVGIGTSSPARALEINTDGTQQLRLTRTDSTINGNNTIGTIEFVGTDDTSGTIGATIAAHASTTWGGGSYPTDLRFSTMTGSTLSERLRIDASGSAVFNETGVDADFRVESNGNANMLFVDGGNNGVGIGTNVTGNSTLEVRSTGVDGTFANAIGFQFSGNSNEANTISTSVSSNAGGSGFKFNVSDGGGSSGKTNVATFLRNQIIFNNDSNDQDFRVESDHGSAMLYVDGADDVVLIDSTSFSAIDGRSGMGVALRRSGRAVFTCTNGGNAIEFNALSQAGAAGSINVSGTTTAYNTSSDVRLKENIADADDAGSKIDAIQVRKYDWKADGLHQDYGMIAQELLEVSPEAVSVPENPDEMMGVDYSKLVPMMLKEIQSLRARINALEAE